MKLMLKIYVPLYSHVENLNTNAYPWVSRLPQMFFKISCLSMSKIWNMLRQLYYLDDLLILTNSSFKYHLLKLEMVQPRLSTAGMRVNISKSKFFAEQIEYLGYWITRQGIQPIHNKVETNKTLNIRAPKTRKKEITTKVYWYSQLLSQHVVLQK
jgi:hypothetical protein